MQEMRNAHEDYLVATCRQLVKNPDYAQNGLAS